MKILFIFHTSIIDGGASKSGLNLIKGLRAKGHEIIVVVPEEGELYGELIKNHFYTIIINFKWAYPRFYGNIRSAVKFIPNLFIQNRINRHAEQQLLELVKDIKPDIIHSNSSVIDIGFNVAKKSGTRHVCHHREFGYKDCTAVMWHLSKMLNHPLSYHISITKCIASSRNLLNDNKASVIYNGMYAAAEKKFCEEKENYILYVGGLYKQKGIEDLLHSYALALKKHKNIGKLKIAGDYIRIGQNYYENLRSLCDHNGITSNVEFLGKVDNVSDLMKKALVMVVPSYYEAFGRVSAEGMFNGALIIGRNSAGTKEQFDNGLEKYGKEIGIRFNTTKDLADKLEEVSKNGFMHYKDMVITGQRCAVELYSNESYITGIEEFYKHVVLNS